VAADEVALSTTDARHFLEWLDEQRQLDHERLLLMAQTVEQLRKDVREQATAMTAVESSNIARETIETRSTDEDVLNLTDRVGRIERVLDAHIENQSRVAQAENAMRDRERRQLADTAQQVESLARTVGLSTSRVAALSEEIRHERDARAPVVHSVDELERVQTSIATRLGALEQMVRRVASTLSVVEVSDEKVQTGLARAENQIKLVDLRVTREVAEVQRIVDEWRLRVDDQIRPVDGLLRQVGQLADQRETWQARIVAIGETIDRVTQDLTAFDSQAKTDRSAIHRGAEAAEALARRLDSAAGSIWQLGERVGELSQDLDQARSDIQSANEQIEAITRRVDLAEEGLQRGDATQLALALDLRNLRTETRTWADSVEGRLDVDTTALAAQAEARYRLSLDHLRRSAEELNQQVREIEANLS
jgi:chromosome segregation ATPase